MLAEVVAVPVTTAKVLSGAVAALFLGAVVVQVVNLLKYARSGNWNAVGTQVTVVVVAFAAITLFAHSGVFNTATIPGLDVPVASLGWTDALIASLVLFGLGGVFTDRTKARDHSQSAEMPALFTSSAKDGGDPQVG